MKKHMWLYNIALYFLRQRCNAQLFFVDLHLFGEAVLMRERVYDIYMHMKFAYNVQYLLRGDI